MSSVYKQSGFTLIEMIVSLALFSSVITISIGALLTMIATNQALQSEQSVMTNLSFALDSMTREIRTGIHYYCASRPNYSAGGEEAIFADSDGQEGLGLKVNDCADGNKSGNDLQGISFSEGGDSVTGVATDRILYFFDNTGGPNSGKILRKVGNGPAQSITSSGIQIVNAEFFVSGSKPQSAGGGGKDDQASVTIFIEAKETDSSTDTYKMQTTVTQRTLDI